MSGEAFTVGIVRGGGSVPITAWHPAGSFVPGIELGGETSAWPRGIAFRFYSSDPVTLIRMAQVRRREDWQPPKFELRRPTLENGKLRFTGVNENALPPGRYRIDMRISGMQFDQSVQDIVIEENGVGDVIFVEKPHKRQLAHRLLPNEYAQPVRDIVLHADSRIDGLTASEWLQQALHCDHRKACLLNILARLACTPSAAETLLAHVTSILHADVDRVYLKATGAFADRLTALPLFKRDRNIHITHKRLLSKSGDGYLLESWREGAKPAMQIVIATPDDKTLPHYADIDIDLGNPAWDLHSLVTHIGELLNPDKTDHLKLHRTLAKGITSEFLYYNVNESPGV